MSPDKDKGDLVEVASAQGEMQGQLIKSLLEGAGIDAIIEGEALRLTHGFTVDGIGHVRILVRPEDVETARAILAARPEEEPE